MSKTLSILAVILVAWQQNATAQLEVRADVVQQLSGVDEVTSVGNAVVISGDVSEIALKPAGLITVLTEAANVEVDAEDRDRRRVEVQQLDSSDGVSRYIIRDSGKFWIDVVAIDFEKNIYKREYGIVLDVPAPAPVGPVVPDVEPPSQILQSYVVDITSKLRESPEKALAVSVSFAGFADGAAVVKPKDVATFREILRQAILTLSLPEGINVGREIEKAIARHVGIEEEDGKYKDRPLVEADHLRIAEVFDAVSWAAGEATK